MTRAISPDVRLTVSPRTAVTLTVSVSAPTPSDEVGCDTAVGRQLEAGLRRLAKPLELRGHRVGADGRLGEHVRPARRR